MGSRTSKSNIIIETRQASDLAKTSEKEACYSDRLWISDI